MKKILRLSIIALILTILIFPIVNVPALAQTQSPVIQEYLNTGGNGDSAQIYGLNYEAMQFTSLATAHTVVNVQLMLKRVGSPGTITVALQSASSGLPNTTVNLATGTINGNAISTSYNFYQATLTTTSTTNPVLSLNGSTQYAIVVSAPNGDGSNYVLWQVVTAGSLANAVASASTNGGVSWSSASPADALFAIYGNPVLSIISVRAFQSYLQPNDILITAEVNNNYPPYATTTGYDPGQTFAVQLLSLDGSTVLASTPLVGFGDYPESIYLSASSATAITVGGAYIFRVIGTFSSPPSVTHTLTSTDWGGDLVNTKFAYFDTWVRMTAQNMENTYGLTSGTLISLITGGGWKLTNTGGAYFTQSIPGMMSVRPSLFAYAKSSVIFNKGTNNTVNYGESDFESAVGTQVAGIATTFGGLLGLDGYVFMGYLIEAAIAIILIIGLMASGGAGALAIMLVGGVPLLFIGNYIHAIGIQWTIVFAALMFFVFVRQFYWKTT